MYRTRHTFASLMLSSGQKPQLGSGHDGALNALDPLPPLQPLHTDLSRVTWNSGRHVTALDVFCQGVLPLPVVDALRRSLLIDLPHAS
jgi:hypothetical protein